MTEITRNTAARLSILMALMAVLAGGAGGQTVIHVDEQAVGLADGTTWLDAFTDLQAALAASTSGDEIRVAQGTYRPHETDPNVSFALVDGVALRGGYPRAGGGLFPQRDPERFVTILSGDLGTNNSYHVVTAGPGVGSGTLLEGFTITGGNAAGGGQATGGGMLCDGSPNVSRCVFIDNRAASGGGGVECTGSATFSGCRFLGNFAGVGGGAACSGSMISATFASCLFSGNEAVQFGGGLAVAGTTSGVAVIGCTFSANTAIDRHGGIASFDDPAVTVDNTILWGNVQLNNGQTPPQMNQGAQIGGIMGNPPSVSHSVIQGLQSPFNGNANIGTDPQFVDPDGSDDVIGTLDDDLRPSSHASIDSGDNAAQPGSLTRDVGGDPRSIDDPLVADTGSGTGAIDRGCYEIQLPPAYPGTDEDLRLDSRVNDERDTTGIYSVQAGDRVAMHLASPQGEFLGTVPVVIGQAFTTGQPPVSPFLGIVVDPTATPAPFVILDGGAGGPLGSFLLPSGGFAMNFIVPAGLSGSSVLVQGFAVTAASANGIFASTNGLEIGFQ